MESQFDALAIRAGHAARRREVFRGLGGLAIGALGIHALSGPAQDAEAKRNNKRCKHCKQKCRKKNRRKNNKNQKNCGNTCRNTCP